MSEYIPTIGLEIHAELKTQTKMFCNSKNDPDEKRPNVNVCPVCLAHPGTLPVINREAVRHVLRVGVALGSELADYTEFDRKSYFYPDLPKGYQISQFEYPLVRGGELKGVAITRIHLEEDTASSVHLPAQAGGERGEGTTLVDFNRSGVPLMELVTEPVIRSAEEAGAFARELQLLLRTLGVSNANMEKGEMRVEANVSVAKRGERSAAYVEIKNLNSFRTMEKAIAYEIRRQTNMLDAGETLVKQTLGWDENTQATFPQRTKEGSADYRYFPDPDLPSLKISEIEGLDKHTLASSIPELPEARRQRYVSLGVKKEDAESFVATPLGIFFEQVIEGDSDVSKISLAANYIANDLVKEIRDTDNRDTGEIAEIPISALNFKEIIDMLASGRISSRSAKDILSEAISSKQSPLSIAEAKQLFQVSDESLLDATIDQVFSQNAAAVQDLLSGKSAALEYLVGQCMRSLRGAGNPSVIRERIKAKSGIA